jgi:DNA-binding CsgD family transcriptional regulator
MPQGPALVSGAVWPLTGREAELAEVRAALLTDPPRSLMLSGPAGVGKTRLAREAHQLAAESGRTVHWLSATYSLARTPLGVFAPILPPVEMRAAASSFAVQDLLARSARALLGENYGNRVIVFVDDAHLLDELSASLLHQLATAHRVPLVLTLRSGEIVPEPITALWKDDVVARLELERLDETAVDQLLTSVLGGRVDPAAAARLAERSDGNVLFLRELTSAALAQGTLVHDHQLWRLVGELAPSQRIVELVGARLLTLDERSLELLELVAYAEPLGGAELAQLAPDEAVRPLLKQGLVVSRFAGRRHELRLAHPLYGEVVRARTSALRIAEMGRALADIAEAGPGRRRDDVLRQGIWRLDGGGGDPRTLLQAAWSARWHYDFVLTERLARAADSGPQAFEAQLLAARAVALQGRPREAEIELRRLADVADNDADRTKQAIAHIECLWFYLGRLRDGLVVAEQAEAGIADPALKDEIIARRAGLVLGLQGPDATVEIIVPVLDRITGPTVIWSALLASYSLGRQGRINAALAAAEKGSLAAAGVDQPDDWYPWFLLFARCEVLALAGRFAEADALGQEQYQRGLADGSNEARAFFLWHRARAALEQGHAAAAARYAREANALAYGLGRLGFQHSLLSLVASACALRGDPAGAREALAELATLDVDQPGWSLVEHLSALGWTALAEQRPEEALDQFRAAVTAGTAMGDRAGALGALQTLARLGRAPEVVEQVRSMAATMEGDLTHIRLEHVEALATRDVDRLRSVAARCEELGLDLYAAEAATVAGGLLRSAGDRREAEASLNRAAALAARCEGVRTPALLSAPQAAALTPAELETAQLAAAGRTSREIADRLDLSVRTVDNRLQSVYQKLGIRRRSELRGRL